MNVLPVTFLAPWALIALTTLPILWWLLRVTPPSPRTENFPAVRLLLGLRVTEETPHRTPWWLLALRLAAAALVIIALARPVLNAEDRLPGSGTVVLVIDNGWAAATDWPLRTRAAAAVLDRAARDARPVALLATAPDGGDASPRPLVPVPVADARAAAEALRPRPWPPDRAAAAAALRAMSQKMEGRKAGAVIYIGDGLTHGADFAAFAAAMTETGPVTAICCGPLPARVLPAPEIEADRMVVRVAQVPQPVAGTAAVLARSGDGRTLERVIVPIPAGEPMGTAGLELPLELRNQLTQLVLEGPPAASSAVLLDERWRRRPAGIVAGDGTSADSPFSGALYYLRRALGPFTEIRTGGLDTILQRDISVLILADRPLAGPERDVVKRWVENGGMLIRFAGPLSADGMSEGAAEGVGGSPDDLLPVKLLNGDRQLGGALSWSVPAGMAAFPAGSPFAGLTIPDDVKVNRQVLAEPGAALGVHTWASLVDGTPLVTQAARGAGRIVLFHVTANADWSNLPLSGLFVDMLRRLTALSAGVATAADGTVLAPAETLDGFGQLTPPPPSATGLAADAFTNTPVSSRHPPGLYGPENGRRALNLGTTLPRLEAASPVPGARAEPLQGGPAERALGPWLLAAGVALLLVDMLLALALRGLLRPRVAAMVFLLLGATPSIALEPGANPALTTRLGFIVSGDARVDDVSRAGLEGLSEYVNRRSAATLTEPDAVEPGKTDLSPYPLLYWPVLPETAALSEAWVLALNEYMGRGGIIVIDTRDAGSGAGFAPGADEALRRVARGLSIPALAPLTAEHVLARAFYLLPEFPGRFSGETVWVQRDQDRANDSVSPVIIGGNDWASAWAVDSAGRNPYAVIPGGQRQRVLAYRFGVNLVMYALTGNYKGDQVHVPSILQRLGQ